jgi:hypothetical protein
VTVSDRLTLTIELRRAVSVPTGSLVLPDGSRVEFEGWLQLLTALAAANIGEDTPSRD